jgi:hypothetical protein
MDISPLAGLGNTLNGWLTMFSVDRNTKVRLRLDYEYGRMYEILDTRHIYFGDFETATNINKYWNAHFLVLKSETDEQSDTKTNPWRTLTYNPVLDRYFDENVHIGISFNPDLLCEKVKRRYLSAINDIVWSYPVAEAIKSLYITENSLGISVRTWKASHEKNIDRSYAFDVYKDAIVRTTSENKIKHIYFSIDNEEFKQPYIDLFSVLGLKYTELNQKYTTMTASQSTILKAMALAKCEFLICNYQSTFSSLVYWFSNLRIKVIPLMNQ